MFQIAYSRIVELSQELKILLNFIFIEALYMTLSVCQSVRTCLDTQCKIHCILNTMHRI